MTQRPTETQITERKVMRRGLMAGLAGLGAAALLKLTGAGKAEPAEAVATALLYPNASGDGATTNTSTNTTNLNLASGARGPAFVVSTSGTASAARDAVYALAGGTGSVGLVAVGSGGASAVGHGVEAQGGDGSSGVNGSFGVFAFGGTGGVGGSGATGGVGVQSVGGFGNVKHGDGVQGFSGSGKGVYGQSTSSDGVHGTSTNSTGIRGTSPNFVGVVGISDLSMGLYGYTIAPNVPALYAENLGPSGRLAARFNGDVQVTGSFVVSGGAKNAAVPMPDGSEAVVYCQESPEPYFEDFGRAQLSNGISRVQLEPEFASIVHRENYMVFPVAEGDCNGLYVSSRDAQGFEVRELKGGKSSLTFTYRVVARRKDIEGKRLARLDPKVKQNIAKMRADSAAKMPAAAMAGRVEAPLVPHEPIGHIEQFQPANPRLDPRR